MAEQEKAPKRKRRDWIIILIIILIGFLCVILAGGWAIRFSPTWKMDTDMGSNIDPDSIFLTSRPSGFLEPLDPSILTQPVWINVFLTPGASFLTSVPVTTLPTNTPLATNTTAPTAITSPTITAVIPSPTNTLIYFPPFTNTPKPPSTKTPVPPLSADLSITKSDGVTVYSPGGSLTYTIVVSNASGPDAITGATVTDTFPATLTNITWTCAPAGSASCSANGTGNINDTVNLAVGSSVTYTVDVDILGSTSGDLSNTATVSVPVGVNDPSPGNNSATDIDTVVLNADLQIIKTDNATDYVADAWKTYNITIYNDGPSDVNGATVSDVFSTNTNINQSSPIIWGCLNCTPILGGTGDINQSVNIPSKSSVTFTAVVQVAANPSGNLVNTATVTVPSGVNDPNPGNNSATDSDTLISTTYGNIGTGQDGVIQELPAGGPPLILALSSSITIGTHAGPDIIYYERDTGGAIAMDWVILEVSSDGSTWYPILNWGDGSDNPGTNITLSAVVPPNNTENCTGEPDDCNIDAAILANGTGVTIDLDALGTIPNGTVISYIRITIPPGGTDGGTGIDGIYVVP